MKNSRFITESCRNSVFFSTREITVRVVFKGRSRRQLTLSPSKPTRRFSSLCCWFISRYSINGINKTIYNILRFSQRPWGLLLWKCFIDFSRVSLFFHRYNDQSPFHSFSFFFFYFSYISVFFQWMKKRSESLYANRVFFVVYYFKKKRKKINIISNNIIIRVSKFSYSFTVLTLLLQDVILFRHLCIK